MTTESPWNDYSTNPPPTEGTYEWRVPSRMSGLVVRMHARFRERGAGHRSVLSPSFDRWDGYQLHVPAGTQWRDAGDVDVPSYKQTLVCVEGVEFEPCPFCKSQPTLVGVERSGRGIVLTSNIHEFNSWWLECCGWTKTPHFSDPRDLARTRRDRLAKAESQSHD